MTKHLQSFLWHHFLPLLGKTMHWRRNPAIAKVLCFVPIPISKDETAQCRIKWQNNGTTCGTSSSPSFHCWLHHMRWFAANADEISWDHLKITEWHKWVRLGVVFICTHSKKSPWPVKWMRILWETGVISCDSAHPQNGTNYRVSFQQVGGSNRIFLHA